jgi:carbamoyltransferase
MMILGLALDGDPGACLLDDGRLRIAIAEASLSRRERPVVFPAQAVRRTLAECGLSPSDLDAVAIAGEPADAAPRKLLSALARPRDPRGGVARALAARRANAAQADWHRAMWSDPRRPTPLRQVPAHLAGAAASFLLSELDSAAIMSIEPAGRWVSIFLGKAEGRQVDSLAEIPSPHSPALLEEAIADLAGPAAAGALAPLAPDGDPRPHLEKARELVHANPTADALDLEIDPRLFGGRVFGPPPQPDAAASLSAALGEALVELARRLRARSKARTLVIAGADPRLVARLQRDSGFDQIDANPIVGKNTAGLGAAAILHHLEYGLPRLGAAFDPFVGPASSEEQIDKAIAEAQLTARPVASAASAAAALLAEGRVVGWFEGRMELGGRPLGARAILASPAHAHAVAQLGRPALASVTIERGRDFFEGLTEDPFRARTARPRPDKSAGLGPLLGADGEVEVQTVSAAFNGPFHRLLVELGKATGVPCVASAPLAPRGEPDAPGPREAIRAFRELGLDALVLGPRVLERTRR